MNANNFKKILVPVDGSKYSEKALRRACELVKVFDSKLVLIYVVEKSIPINLLDRKEYLKILRKFGNKVLVKGQETIIKQGVDSKMVLKEGNIANEISQFSKTEKCDLIIVGSKGLGATARLFLGSVSNKLAQSSPCSVLIVK